jgi:hypothetical protein
MILKTKAMFSASLSDLVFLMEANCVLCEVRTESFYAMNTHFIIQMVKMKLSVSNLILVYNISGAHPRWFWGGGGGEPG